MGIERSAEDYITLGPGHSADAHRVGVSTRPSASSENAWCTDELSSCMAKFYRFT